MMTNIITKMKREEEREREVVDGRWLCHRYAQGHAVIFLTREGDNGGDRAPEPGDIVVATVERWGKVTVLRPDLLQRCPFDYFNDGFYFTHPSGQVVYHNLHGTPVPKEVSVNA